jgi:hypothetical protein
VEAQYAWLIITGLATAIVSLCTFIAWMWRDSLTRNQAELTRAYERITYLEKREDTTIEAMAASVAAGLEMQKNVVTVVQEVRWIVGLLVGPPAKGAGP